MAFLKRLSLGSLEIVSPSQPNYYCVANVLKAEWGMVQILLIICQYSKEGSRVRITNLPAIRYM